MKAKSTGIIALGVMSIGLLFGLIVGALAPVRPGGFSLPGMLITWCIFGVASIVLLVMSGVLKSHEIQIEESKQTPADETPDSSDSGDSGYSSDSGEISNPTEHNAINDVVARCINCGHELGPDDIICPECATPANSG